MKKLTIGIFVEHYDPFISGVVNSVKAMKYELEKAGHTVYVVCPSVRGYKDKDPHVIRTAAFKTRLLDNTTVGFATPKVTKRLMAIKFDIIHAQDVYFVSLLGLRIARRQNIPYVQTIHTLWDKFFDQYRLNPLAYLAFSFPITISYLRMFSWREMRQVFWRPKHDEHHKKWPLPSRFVWQHMLNLCDQADAVIVPSIHQQKALRDAGLKKPIIRITNSYPPFQPAEPVLPKAADMMRILCVARLSDEKRVDVLIEAMHELNDPKVELVIVGEGTALKKLKQQTHDYGLSANVIFLGVLDNQKVRQLMRESDVLALASYNFDTQPMVFDEALDAGLPIVYCDPKFIEAVSDKNALLVKKDAKGFAGAFRLLKNSARRARFAAASQKMASEFRSDKAAALVQKVYAAVLKD